MGNLSEFLSYLEEEVKNGSLYAWGGQGEKATLEAIERRESQEANRRRVIALYRRRVAAGYEDMKLFDCSGLGTYFLYNQKRLIGSDKTANGLKALCRSICRSELLPGDFVFRVYRSGSEKGRAYHIGYVADRQGNVIEAKGRDDGVVKRALSAGGSGYWNAYGRPDCLREEIEGQTEARPDGFVLERLLKKTSPLMTGPDVKSVQQALMTRGYSCGGAGADGAYGRDTRSAVKAFQRASGLSTDGIVGEKTAAALGGSWRKAERFRVSRVLKKTSPLMTGPDVKSVQQALMARGYSCGSTGADGAYGRNTRSAVKAFQKASGLAADGKAGRDTVTALGGSWQADE